MQQQRRSEERGAPRRTKAGNHPGVYFRLDASGRRRYEITFRDSDGRRRWQVVPGGVKDADAKLAELRAGCAAASASRRSGSRSPRRRRAGSTRSPA